MSTRSPSPMPQDKEASYINQLMKQAQSQKPGNQKQAVEELVYLLKSEDEDQATGFSAYEALKKLAVSGKDLLVQKLAKEGLERYPSPEKRFASHKHGNWTWTPYWQPHPSDPEIVSVSAGLFLMGSDQFVGIEIPTLAEMDHISPQPNEYLSEAVANQLLLQNSNALMSYPDERPLHSIYLNNFKIGTAPVTNSQYSVFIQDSGYTPPLHWLGGQFQKGYDDFPVVNVSWFDAMEYCEWLTLRWKRLGRINENAEVRLPTEAEWEKAARGTDGRIYPWGQNFDAKLCNHRVLGFGEPVPVNYFPLSADSPYGCKGMAGNVWDWTLSIWGKGARHPHYKYPYNSNDGRESIKADLNNRKVIRGGAFYYYIDCLRCAVRNRTHPLAKHPGGSFRIVVAQKNLLEAMPTWLVQKF